METRIVHGKPSRNVYSTFEEINYIFCAVYSHRSIHALRTHTNNCLNIILLEDNKFNFIEKYFPRRTYIYLILLSSNASADRWLGGLP